MLVQGIFVSGSTTAEISLRYVQLLGATPGSSGENASPVSV